MEKEQRKKLSRRIRIGLMATGLVAAIAIPVYAVTQTSWKHPCKQKADLTCRQPIGVPCWCEGDFNDSAHWSNGTPGGQATSITHSNDSVTDEAWLEMVFDDSDEPHTLKIKTKDTGGADELEIQFESAAGGQAPYTTSVTNEVIIDATNGTVTLEMESGGTIMTDRD